MTTKVVSNLGKRVVQMSREIEVINKHSASLIKTHNSQIAQLKVDHLRKVRRTIYKHQKLTNKAKKNTSLQINKLVGELLIS